MTLSHHASIHRAAAASRPGPVLAIDTGRAIARAAADDRREDRLLVDRVLAGEPEAFAELHALHAPRLYGFALKRIADPAEAEDVVQDVFLEVHRSLASWEGRSRLSTWLFGIAHHQLCRRFRKRTIDGVSIDRDGAPELAAQSLSGEDQLDARRMLETCMDVLHAEVTDAQREIFELYHARRRATREIAREVGKSTQAVKISLFRTRRAMEARLEERGMKRTA